MASKFDPVSVLKPLCSSLIFLETKENTKVTSITKNIFVTIMWVSSPQPLFMECTVSKIYEYMWNIEYAIKVTSFITS